MTLFASILLLLSLLIKKNLIFNIYIIGFWVISYSFLILSFIFSNETYNVSDITEIFIPLSTVLFSFSFYSILNPLSADEVLRVQETVYKYLALIIFILFVFAVLEYTNNTTHIQYFFYKPFDKYLGSTRVVGVFSYPYYLSFFLAMAISVALPFLLKRKSIVNFLIISFILIAAFLAQSQSGFVSILLFITSYFLFNYPSFYRLLKVLPIILALSILGMHYFDKIISWLATNTELYTFRAMNRIITDPGSSGTLNVRLEQIKSAFNTSIDSYFLLGTGWGRNVLLESWPAYLIHKYGVTYTLFIITVWIYFLLKLLQAYSIYYHHKKYVAYHLKSYLLFFMLLPISLSSAFVLFTHKLTVLFCFILFASISLINPKKNNDFNHK